MEDGKTLKLIGAVVSILNFTIEVRATKYREITYTTNCSVPIPTIRPRMAPTTILGINRPHGTWKNKTIQTLCSLSKGKLEK